MVDADERAGDGGTSAHSWKSNSGVPLRRVYGPQDIPEGLADAVASPPGEPPFLRGVYPEMYRSKLWRIFQLSGFGDPQDMNDRLRFLLRAGETGVIIKHDRMTDDHLYDVDNPEIVERSEDVGLTGTVTVGLRDYETILDGLPIESIYAKPGGGVVQSAPYTLSCYWSVAQRRGIPLERLAGTGQSDFFLTYIGCPCKEQIPPAAGLRFNLDLIEWCTERMPRWVPVSIAGYNGADSGLNAYQELGAVFANAVEYIDGTLARGKLDIKDFVKAVGGVNFRTSMDLFEEIAKLRVARKMWHDLLASRYGLRDPEAMRLRIHVVTAGSYMAYQEPFNNIVRGTVMALAAALGGVQSLGVSGYDEAISIPSDHAHLMSIRIQQILQEETNIAAVADPVGGAPYVEHLSAELEQRAWEFFEEIQDQGGFLSVLESGWLLERAEEGQVEQAFQTERGERRVVGVNCHHIEDPILTVDGFEGRPGSATWEGARKRLEELRRTRDSRMATQSLRELDAVCRSSRSIVPAVMGAVQADASIGEIGAVFRDALGDWTAPLRY